MDEHQNCSTKRTDRRVIPHDFQRVEGKKEAAPVSVFPRRKEQYNVRKHCGLIIREGLGNLSLAKSEEG
jgi:hypothetical protein